MEQRTTIYYKARDELTIDKLPIFFGSVEVRGGKAVGTHFRATTEKADREYVVGYYWLELEADAFFQKFTEHQDIEISADEFSAILGRWIQRGKRPPYCWNPEHNPSISRVVD
jgi:hypothetical protein